MSQTCREVHNRRHRGPRLRDPAPNKSWQGHMGGEQDGAAWDMPGADAQNTRGQGSCAWAAWHSQGLCCGHGSRVTQPGSTVIGRCATHLRYLYGAQGLRRMQVTSASSAIATTAVEVCCRCAGHPPSSGKPGAGGSVYRAGTVHPPKAGETPRGSVYRAGTVHPPKAGETPRGSVYRAGMVRASRCRPASCLAGSASTQAWHGTVRTSAVQHSGCRSGKSSCAQAQQAWRSQALQAQVHTLMKPAESPVAMYALSPLTVRAATVSPSLWPVQQNTQLTTCADVTRAARHAAHGMHDGAQVVACAAHHPICGPCSTVRGLWPVQRQPRAGYGARLCSVSSSS